MCAGHVNIYDTSSELLKWELYWPQNPSWSCFVSINYFSCSLMNDIHVKEMSKEYLLYIQQ